MAITATIRHARTNTVTQQKRKFCVEDETYCRELHKESGGPYGHVPPTYSAKLPPPKRGPATVDDFEFAESHYASAQEDLSLEDEGYPDGEYSYGSRSFVPDTQEQDQGPEVPHLTCFCRLPCAILKATTDKNRGREFSKCPKPLGDAGQCKFFQWLDEAQLQGPASGNNPHPGTAEPGNFVDLTAGEVTQPPATKGECFHCHEPGHWSRDCPKRQATAAQGAYGSSPVGQASSTCFHCQGTGHWARDCPNKDRKVASSYSGGICSQGGWGASMTTGRGGGVQMFSPTNGSRGQPYGSASGSGDRSGSCFKCGGTGHWSRDCPSKTAQGGYQGRGGGGGSGTCYKCGQTGHWARDCAAGP